MRRQSLIGQHRGDHDHLDNDGRQPTPNAKTTISHYDRREEEPLDRRARS
jgi:hypothetical protein